MKLNRVLFLLAALPAVFTAHADLASLLTNVAPATATRPPRLPSIIFIQCHDLARGDLSCYGQTNYQTPNLDQLAANGIRFTQYTGGADSAVTTAQLLAGNISAPTNGEPNLAQCLQKNGYHTGLIGEWSQTGKPWNCGFDEFAGFLTDTEAQNYYADALWRYAPNSIFDSTNSRMVAFTGKEMIYPNTGGKKGVYLPELFINAMNNFVRVNTPDATSHYRPFFLLMNFPMPRSATLGADDFVVPSDAPFTEEKWPQAAKNRAALITRLDNGIGKLFEQLKSSGMTNNVAVFFTSSSAPEKFANTNLNFLLPATDFRNANKPAALPMIVNWPGTIPAKRVSQAPWSVTDFAPTALSIAFAKPADNFTGISLLPILTGEKKAAAPDAPNLPTGQ